MSTGSEDGSAPKSRYGRWLLGLISAAAALYLLLGGQSKPEPGPPGWDDLVLCFELTSIDSNKSLSLNEDFTARLKDSSGSGDPIWSDGHWSLVNADRHVYKVDLPGASGVYTVVSPPDSEGCLLAAGPLDRVDLRRSWFSVAPEPPDPGQ